MVFRPQRSYGHAVNLRAPRARVQFIPGVFAKPGEALMQIYAVFPAHLSVEQRLCGQVLIRMNTQINIPIRSQPGLDIQSRDGPALNQHRLDSM